MSEFDLIAALRHRLGAIGADRLHLGIGDDAALWRPTPGQYTVLCCDTLIAGRHFPHDTDPADVAWKALAVNLSDLAAMAADPVCALLALTVPEPPSAAWIDAFCDGWSELAQMHSLALAGGDTTRGASFSLTVTCIGEVATGAALRRDAAQVSDGIYVSGLLGDAALALSRWNQPTDPRWQTATERLRRPLPRVALGRALRGIAHAAIDLSDGLASDLRHITHASGVGAIVDVMRLPLSDTLRTLGDAMQMQQFALSGGDDYELCFTVPAEREPQLCAVAAATGVRITRIGEIVAGSHILLTDASGHPAELRAHGWDHFRT